MKRLQRHPRIIYHYTTAEGVFGILDEGVVWASDSRFMNDAEELKLAIGALARRVELHLSKVKQRENRAAIESAIGMAVNSGFSAYVASFTEAGNMLSQWRAYAPRDGMAIGFLTKALAEVPGFRLARCEYIDELEFTRPNRRAGLLPVMRKVDRCVRRLAGLSGRAGQRRTFDESVSDRRLRYKMELANCLLGHAVWLKHRGFSEEREWRLARYEPAYVPHVYSDPPAEFRPRFRSGPLGITPYLAAVLPSKIPRHPLGLAHIVVGPSPNGQASADALNDMLQARFGEVVRARWCGLPYRGW